MIDYDDMEDDQTKSIDFDENLLVDTDELPSSDEDSNNEDEEETQACSSNIIKYNTDIFSGKTIEDNLKL